MILGGSGGGGGGGPEANTLPIMIQKLVKKGNEQSLKAGSKKLVKYTSENIIFFKR